MWQKIIDFINGRFPVKWSTGKKWVTVVAVLALFATFIAPGSYAVANMPSEDDILAKADSQAQTYTNDKLTGFVTIDTFGKYQDDMKFLTDNLTAQDVFLESLCAADNATFQNFYYNEWVPFFAGYISDNNTQNAAIAQLNTDIQALYSQWNSTSGLEFSATITDGGVIKAGSNQLNMTVHLDINNLYNIDQKLFYTFLNLVASPKLPSGWPHGGIVTIEPPFMHQYPFSMYAFDSKTIFIMSNYLMNLGPHGHLSLDLLISYTFAEVAPKDIYFDLQIFKGLTVPNL